MYRATTPQHRFIFDTKPSDSYSKFWISYSQGGTLKLTRKITSPAESRVTINGVQKWALRITLTQAETKQFDPDGCPQIAVQMRVLEKKAQVSDPDRVYASPVFYIPLADCLNTDEISSS